MKHLAHALVGAAIFGGMLDAGSSQVRAADLRETYVPPSVVARRTTTIERIVVPRHVVQRRTIVEDVRVMPPVVERRIFVERPIIVPPPVEVVLPLPVVEEDTVVAGGTVRALYPPRFEYGE